MSHLANVFKTNDRLVCFGQRKHCALPLEPKVKTASSRGFSLALGVVLSRGLGLSLSLSLSLTVPLAPALALAHRRSSRCGHPSTGLRVVCLKYIWAGEKNRLVTKVLAQHRTRVCRDHITANGRHTQVLC